MRDGFIPLTAAAQCAGGVHRIFVRLPSQPAAAGTAAGSIT